MYSSSLGMDSLMQIGIISLLAQIPQAAISATELYSKHPYLACGLFAAVLLVLLAYKVLGGGASDRFQKFDYRPWSWRRFWERRDVAKKDALGDIVIDPSTKHRVVRNVKRQVDPEVRSAAEDMGLEVSNLNQGTVMWGDAGVGKTALLIAVAQVLSVAIFIVPASDLVNEYQGSGPKNVGLLFAAAISMMPCMIFLEETDGLFGRASLGQHPERAATLIKLFAEMDRIRGLPIAVVGATNLLDLLDPALLRPLRLGLHVHIPLPDLAQRADILRVHMGRIRRVDGVDFARIAAATDGWSGARLQELVVSAADRALERGLAAGVASSVGMADFVGLLPGPPPSPPPSCSQVGCWSAWFGC